MASMTMMFVQWRWYWSTIQNNKRKKNKLMREKNYDNGKFQCKTKTKTLIQNEREIKKNFPVIFLKM